MRQNRLIRLIFLLFLLPLLIGCPPQYHQVEPAPLAATPTPPLASPPQGELLVRGEATLKFTPDQVELSLEVLTQEKSAEAALAGNSAAIVELQRLLEAEGLGPESYRTGQFSIQPQMSRPPRPAPANWRPEIVGYRVRNSLLLSTERVELAGRLLALAQQAGVNKAGNLRFSLVDPEEAQRQAISAATVAARQRAAVLAEAAGVALGGLLEARIEEQGSGPRPQLMMAEASSARAKVNHVPLSAGEVEVSAAVILRYVIAE